MKRYAVSWVGNKMFFGIGHCLEIVNATNFRQALLSHSVVKDIYENEDEFPESRRAFDCIDDNLEMGNGLRLDQLLNRSGAAWDYCIREIK